MELPIGFTQAALGTEMDVPTLTSKVEQAIPRGTQHGTLFRLHGEGLPNLRSGRRGDLILVTRVEIPKKLSDQQEKLLREFAETEDQSVMPESHGFLKKIRDLF